MHDEESGCGLTHRAQIWEREVAAEDFQHVAAGAAFQKGHREAHAALDSADLALRRLYDPKLRLDPQPAYSSPICVTCGSSTHTCTSVCKLWLT